jgi:hypothetical protein
MQRFAQEKMKKKWKSCIDLSRIAVKVRTRKRNKKNAKLTDLHFFCYKQPEDQGKFIDFLDLKMKFYKDNKTFLNLITFNLQVPKNQPQSKNSTSNPTIVATEQSTFCQAFKLTSWRLNEKADHSNEFECNFEAKSKCLHSLN